MSKYNNSINIKQNEVDYLRYKYVFRKCYSSEKRIRKWTMIISMAIYLFGLIPTIKDFKLTTLIPIIWLVISLCLERKRNIIHSEAVEFHEYCDREMFELPIYNGIIDNKDMLNKKAIEITESISDKDAFEEMCQKEHKASIRDWYSDMSNLPLKIARIVAQDENIRWEKEQRDIFSKILYSSLIVLFLICCGTIYFTTKNAVDIIYSIPILLELLNIILDNNDSIDRTVSISKEIGKIYGHIKNKGKDYDMDLINDTCLDIQLRIYNNRKEAIPVPDIVYKFFRNKIQRNSNSYIRIIRNDLINALK